MFNLIKYLISLFFVVPSKIVGIDLKKSNKQFFRVMPWVVSNGDNTLRLNYDLNQDSLVIDLGGYKGDFANAIYSKFNCEIHVFEPYEKYADNIKERFRGNSKIIVNTLGLSSKDETKVLFISEEGSSTINKLSSNGVSIHLIEANQYFKEKKIKKIDLLKINIEGGEYDLMEYLIQMNLTGMIENFQIQFHDFVPNALERMENIQKHLSKTHSLTYQFPFVWENWKKKQS